jgi:hypothetical protein
MYRCPAHRATGLSGSENVENATAGAARMTRANETGCRENALAGSLMKHCSGAGAGDGLDQPRRETTFGKAAGIRNICTSLK